MSSKIFNNMESLSQYIARCENKDRKIRFDILLLTYFIFLNTVCLL